METHNQKLPLSQHIQIQKQQPYTSWIEIDSAALQHNIKTYKNIVAPALFAPVIKSNAYGHGMLEVAQICNQLPEVDMMCVVNIAEAIQLRHAGIQKPILVLSIFQHNLDAACIMDIDVVIFDLALAHELNHIGIQHGKKIKVHIKIDTGLSRLGILAAQALAFVQVVAQLPYITIQGIFTHFADSECEDQTFTNLQIERFNELLEKLGSHGIAIPLIHASCSAAAQANNKSHFTLARAGIGIYGLWPSQENKKMAQQLFPSLQLKPVLTWKTSIIQIKEIPAGSFVGYNRTHTTTRVTKTAILPIGYWDGYDRKLSNSGKVIINGQCAPIIGRVAMNLCIIDITDLQAQVGDKVTLLGNIPGITAEDLAEQCQTINYEIVTRINPLLPRIIV